MPTIDLSSSRSFARQRPALWAGLLLLLVVGGVVVIGMGRSTPDAYFNPGPVDPELPDGWYQPVPRGFIDAIEEPNFIEASEVDWTATTDVIGLVIDGDARAYPVSVLTTREMVLDEVGGVPVLVTWCPVCGSALAHDRRVEGETLDFGLQGALWRNAMTWFDIETGSVWSQPYGEALAGPRSGDTLEQLPVAYTTWSAWVAAHPATLALDNGDGFDVRVEVTDLVVVVEHGESARGYPVSGLVRADVVNEVIGDLEVAVFADPVTPERWAVFDRSVDGQVVELMVDGEMLRDQVTGSTFDPVSGRAVSGPLEGSTMTQVPSSTVIPGFGPTRVPLFEILHPEATVWWPAANVEPVVYLPLDGDAVAAVGGVAGEVVGATPVEDRAGNAGGALNFDGVDDHVVFGHDPVLNVVQEFTVSIWVHHREQSVSDAWYTLYEKSDPDRDGHSRYGLWVRDNRLWGCFEQADGAAQPCAQTDVALNAGEWHHLAMVRSERFVYLYVDGVEVDKHFVGFHEVSQTEHQAFLGTDLYERTNVWLNAALDDLAIYDVALTSTQVAALASQ